MVLMKLSKKSTFTFVFVFCFIVSCPTYIWVLSQTQMHMPISQLDLSDYQVEAFVNPRIKGFGNVTEYICNTDKAKTELINIDFKTQTPHQIRTLFHKFVANPHGGRCPSLQRFGGKYHEGCQYWDGQKYVCMGELISDIEKNECLIYSFGVAGDWTFEKAMGSFGCKVLTFDPSVNYKKELEINVSFEKLGLSNVPDQNKLLYTLSTILHSHGHTDTKITYLKMDIEGFEVDALLQMFESGALKNVQQIGLEYHLPDTAKALKFFYAMTKLYYEDEFRLISFDMNGCVGKARTDYTKYAEIVLMKPSEKSLCVENVKNTKDEARRIKEGE